MAANLHIAASGLRNQQERVQSAAHNLANRSAALPSATAVTRVYASEAVGRGVEIPTTAQLPPLQVPGLPSGDLLSTGSLPLLTAPNHANGLTHVIRAQDQMTGILLDMTA